jgi:acetyl-CoA carboxylase carboxyltransferase component
VNAVYYNKIASIEDPEERAEFIRTKREEYEKDVDLLRLASDLVVDVIIEGRFLRQELIARFSRAGRRDRAFSSRRHGVPPV